MLAVTNRASSVVRSYHLHRTVSVAYQPGPSAAEVSGGSLRELLLEAAEIAERLLDSVGDRAACVAATLGRKALPVEAVIPVLGSLVEEYTRFGFLHDLVERGDIGILARRQEFVEARNVGVVMLAVMEFERLFGDFGRERVERVGKLGKLKSHVESLLSPSCRVPKRAVGAGRRAAIEFSLVL